MLRFALICRYNAGQPDGIWDHTKKFADALVRSEKIHVDIHARLSAGDWLTLRVGRGLTRSGVRRRLEDGLEKYEVVILQYNPFMYGRWGFAPWLLRALDLKRRAPHTRVALMVHETYVPMLSWRWTVMGLWQRAQLLALHLEADATFVANQVWAAELAKGWLRRKTHYLPVGSNVPDMSAQKETHRRELRISTGTIVLAAFGQNHPSRLADYIVCAANAAAAAAGSVVLLNLGDGIRGLTGLDKRVALYSPGYLPAKKLARYLSVADIYLAPFIDGVSTRRGTLMAALQHGLAVVGTEGPLTDKLLLSSRDALRLVPVGRPELFAETVRKLTTTQDDRRALGERARFLYQSCFDWPVLARRLTSALGCNCGESPGRIDTPPLVRPHGLSSLRGSPFVSTTRQAH
jgi:glycosyltransferase involved in cell wall biosynthesis